MRWFYRWILVFMVFSLDARESDPQLMIPKLQQAPKIDGVLEPSEWENAIALTMFGYYNDKIGIVTEQPMFYVGWDSQYLYVAMESRENTTNRIVAQTTRTDNRSIVKDDCVEIMVAPGTGKEIQDEDFATFYIAANAIGGLWDARCKVMRNEIHNSWRSGVDFASTVDGTRWCIEMRIPFRSISLKKITPGTKWRMNFCRTFFSYHWVALNPRGALNDARIGADVMFSDSEPVPRLLSIEPLLAGQHSAELELFNPTKGKKTVDVEFDALTSPDPGTAAKKLKSSQKIELSPGERKRISIGSRSVHTRLDWFTKLSLLVKSADAVLLAMDRELQLPPRRLPRQIAPQTQPVDTEMIFFPTFDLLKISFDASLWLKKTGLAEGDFSALISVFKQGSEKPVFTETFRGFNTGKGTWEKKVSNLEEGEYQVHIEVKNKGDKILAVKDWFVRKIFPWMKQFFLPKTVPAPYEPVTVQGNTLFVWGRDFRFGKNALPAAMLTQGKEYLKGPAVLEATVNGKEESPKVTQSFRFGEVAPRESSGSAVLESNGIRYTVSLIGEYDGFVKYHVRCEPLKKDVKLDRLTLRLPLNASLAKFWSASGDSQGVNVLGKVIPEKDGSVYDSSRDTYAVMMHPSFSTYYWVGDHDVCFCYAADTDKGWEVAENKPAVEAYKKDGVLTLQLNLINQPIMLDKPRVMEFAFQTGPVRKRPEDWRSISVERTGVWGNSPALRTQIGGDGFTLHGGTHTLHPGLTPEMWEKSKQRIRERMRRPTEYIVGYHYWGTIAKGFPEVKVFRGEWNISKNDFESGGTFDSSKWRSKTYGPDRAMYYYISANPPVPSMVDFLTWAYDLALTHTDLMGFYDDVGYPKSVYSKEFGLGYEKDGIIYASSGLWLYRDRWKKAMEVNAKHNRRNLLGDTQRVLANFMPVYCSIGVFAPCEAGFYTSVDGIDPYEFFGSLDDYAARTPAKQFGQIPLIGLSSCRRDEAGYDQDSRVACMLAFLHDHTLGSFGMRNERTVSRLNNARGLFRQWEKGVEFHPYWENKGLVKTSDDRVKVSCYTRKGEALLIAGSTAPEEIKEVVLKPDWKKLGVDLNKVRIFDPETLSEEKLTDGTLYFPLKKHDLKLVIAAQNPSLPAKIDWKKLKPPGEKILFASSSPKNWQKAIPEGDCNTVSELYGKICLQGHWDSGYAQIFRKGVPESNFAVQVVTSGAGLIVSWKNGTTFVSSQSNKQFNYGFDKTVRGKNPLSGHVPYGWAPKFFTALKVVFNEKTVCAYISEDGKTWVEDTVFPRPSGAAGPPLEIAVGWGQKGESPSLKNVKKGFSSTGNRRWRTEFCSDIYITKE